QAPEAFDAVDVHGAFDELVIAVIDAEVAIAEIDQAVVAAPAIGVDDGRDIDPTPDNALQRGSGAVWHDLGVDLPGALEDAEHDGLAIGSTTALATNIASAEPALIDFDDAEERTLGFTGHLDPLAQSTVDPVHGVAVQAAELGRLQGRQIGRKTPHQSPNL